MSENPYPIPQSWEWIRLGDIAEIVRQQVDPRQKPETSFNYLSIENVESNSGELVNFEPTKGGKIKSSKIAFTTHDILYSKLRPYLNKVHLPTFAGISATDLIPIRPLGGIPREYIAYFLRSRLVVDYANQRMRGIQLPRVPVEDLLDLQIPLAPSDEQKRIVERIESLIQSIRVSKKSLARVKPLTERFRQSVLAKAFRGELTKRSSILEPVEDLVERIAIERRKAHNSKGHQYKEPERADPGGLPEIPGAWVWVRLEEICSQITDGTHITPKYSEKGIRFLSVKNVREGAILDDDVKYISEEQHRKLIKHCEPKKGDILYTKVGSIGKAALVSVSYDFSIFVSLALLKPLRSVVMPRFLEYQLNSPSVLAQALARKKGIGVPDLHLVEIRDFKVCIPPLQAQGDTVGVLDGFYEKANEIEKPIRRGLACCEILEQSILSKAFRGELVTQDNNDEPASILLQRIRSQRATMNDKGRFQTVLESTSTARITPKT